MNTVPITEADLQAYVDGLLSDTRRAEVEAYLATKPDEAERLRAYTAQNEAIRALVDPVLVEAIPARLPTKPPCRWSGWQRYVAAVAWVLVGGATGWMLRGIIPSDVVTAEGPVAAQFVQASTLAHQAAIAHVVYSPEVRRPVEVGADQEEQLVDWLSKRLGAQLKPPKLSTLGYELIGGRLLPGSEGPVAQFMYHDATGQRLTLYVSTEHKTNQDTAFRFAQEGPVNVFYWIDGQFGYAISAGIDKRELSRIARAVYDQLNPRR